MRILTIAALVAFFGGGDFFNPFKVSNSPVRAVRGGP
jgi:hypothetical protein